MARRKKKTTDTRTVVVLVQDKSGSMHVRRDATISGYNEYKANLAKEAQGEVLVTLVQFDTRVTERFVARDLNSLADLSHEDYVPGGMTALYDAVAKAVNDTAKAVRKDDKVIVVIMTDGGENSSYEYRHDTILKLIEDKRREDWEFIFLGAGEESWNTGQSLGFTRDTSVYYSNDAHDHTTSWNLLAASNAAVTRGSSSSAFLATSDVKAGLETKSGVYNRAQAEPMPVVTSNHLWVPGNDSGQEDQDNDKQ
jgi:uncharacterized protein YegL